MIKHDNPAKMGSFCQNLGLLVSFCFGDVYQHIRFDRTKTDRMMLVVCFGPFPPVSNVMTSDF